MRRIILVTTLAMMLSVVLITQAHKMEGRASASNANLFLAQGGGPTLSINDRSQVEGSGAPSVMVFTVTLTASGTHGPVTVSYATADGSATAPSDYTSRNGALDFPAGTGNATMTISVPIIPDTIVEPDETFFVNLTNADGATITKGQGVGTIINDDSTPTPTPTSTPTPSPTPANCTFTLSPPSWGFDQYGGTRSFSVTTQASCEWQAVSLNTKWIGLDRTQYVG